MKIEFQVIIAIILLMLLLIAAGCSLRIHDVVPEVGNPYQTFLLTHSWRMK